MTKLYNVPALMGAAWCIAWMLLGANTPDECGLMKMEERLFLKRKAAVTRQNVTTVSWTRTSCTYLRASIQKFPRVPWANILTNKAFIAHLVATWILTNVVTIMMVYLPSYFKDVLLLGVIMVRHHMIFLCN